MEYGILSLLPPLLIILMVIITKKVVTSLFSGVVVGCIIIGDFSFTSFIQSIKSTVLSVFFTDGSLNSSNLSILLFLVLLGLLTGFINILEGNRAFTEFVRKKIGTKKGAQASTAAVSLTLFPDDVFNMFTVGQIAQPIFDSFGIARQKLAYIIHTVSDSLCVLFPVSSWGAYIISILTVIFTQQNYELNGLTAFLQIGPYNFYAVTGLLFIFLIIYLEVDFSNMKKASNKNSMQNIQTTAITHSSIMDLLLPIVTLLIIVMTSIIVTGYMGSEEFTLLSIFENANISLSLIIGTTCALLVALILFCIKVFKQKSLALTSAKDAVSNGLKATLPAIIILIFAWMVSNNTSELQTGEYLASFINKIAFPSNFLPLVAFLFTGVMAFSTGTSWGTFAIMLPITAEIALSSDETLLIPILAAVLAGSLFGDHCSPISDTTTVASAAAGCSQMDHFSTQWPYSLTVASIAAMGYLFFALTSSIFLSYLFIITCITLVAFKLKNSK